MGFGIDGGNAHPQCKSVLVPVQPRKAYFQPCPDAHPVEVTVLNRTGDVAVVEAAHGTPFYLMTNLGHIPVNLAPVLLEHIRLLEVRRQNHDKF